MRHEFAQAARDEFLNSIDYYELQQPGLGFTFAEQVNDTIVRILEFPEGWTPLDNAFHRCLVKQFPYALIYTVADQVVIVVAVMNLHRKPGYWRNRSW